MTKLKLTTFAFIMTQVFAVGVANAAVDNTDLSVTIGQTSMSGGLVVIKPSEEEGDGGGQ